MSVTILLMPDSPLASRLIDILRQWEGEGLLGEAFLVQAKNLVAADSAVHEVEAEPLTGDGTSTDVLLELLGRRRLGLVRVVVIQPVDGTKAPPTADPTARLVQMLKSRLPAENGLVVANLIVPTSGVKRIAEDRLIQLEHAQVTNVLVAPEDRVSDSHIDVGVRRGKNGNFEGHVALAVASVSGLWRGLDGAPFDQRPFPSVAERMVVVCRSFASVVQVEPFVDSVASAVLSPRDHWPVPDQSSADAPIPALDDGALVSRLLEECSELDSGAFKYRPPAVRRPPKLQRVGILRAFVNMFLFLGRRLGRAPLDLAEHMKGAVIERAERMSQAVTYGEGSGIAVRFAGRDDRPEACVSIDELAEDAQRLLQIANVASASYFPPTPEIWRSLRSMCLATVDGSELPADFAAPMAGDRRQVITKPGFLGPDPFDEELPGLRSTVTSALGSSEPTLEPGDPLAADAVCAALQQRIETVSDDEETSKPEAATASALAQVESWRAKQRRALLWQLASKLGEQVLRAREDLGNALAALDASKRVAVGDQLRRAWRSCRNMWLLSLAVAAFGTYLVWANVPSAQVSWIATGAIAVLLFTVWLVVYIRYQRVEFQVLHRLQVDMFHLEEAHDVALHCAREVVRLAGLYQQLVAWSVIIGAVLHRPFGDGPRQIHSPGPHPEIERPKAFSIRRGRADPERVARLAAAASHSIYSRGWLGECYRLLAEWSLDHYANRHALDAIPEPERDTPQADTGARTNLAQDATSGDGTRTAADRGLARVTAFCRDHDPATLVSTVEPLANVTELEDDDDVTTFLGRAIPTAKGPQNLTADIWTDGALVNEANEVRQCFVWEPRGLHMRSQWEGADYGTMPVVALSDGGLSLKVARLDCAAPAGHHDIALFSPTGNPRASAQATSDGDSD